MTRSALPRRIVALLMVFVLVFVCSPIKAEAVVLDTVLLAAPLVCGAILLGIGIFQLTGTQGFQNAVNACVHFLSETTDFIADSSVECLAYYNEGNKLIHAVDVQLVEAVRQWVIDSGLVSVESVSSYAQGFTQVSVGFSTQDIVTAYWDSFPFYDVVNNSDSGFLLVGSLGTQFYGIFLNSDGLIYNVVLDSIAPYNSENYPCGEFVGLDQFSGTIQGPSLNDNGYLVFTNYEAAYEFWKVTPGEFYYLTEQTTMRPHLTNSQTFRMGFDFTDLGRISSNGTIANGVSLNLYGGSVSYETWPYAIVPTMTVTDSYVGNGVGVGAFADPDEDIYSSYPVWVQNAIASGSVNYVPLGMTGAFSSTAGLTQEQIWTGNIYAEAPIISWEEDWQYITYYDVGETPSPLFAKAFSPDGGTLTYQWFANAQPIPGAQTAVLYPPTSDVGEVVYQCLVTNIVSNEAASSTAWTLSYKIVVTQSGVEVAPTVDVNADAFQDSISDAITDYDSMQGVLDGGDLPSYSDIDPSFKDIFDEDGIGLATDALKELFGVSGGYIFRVFFIAFMLGCVSFVVFGKRR